MKVAALDLGSNTFLLLVAEVDSQGKVLEVLEDECRITRLSEGVNQTKEISSAAFHRAEEALKEFSKIISKLKIDKVKAVATSAARDAKNSSQFFQLAQKYNIPIDIISGELEAKLTYSGALEGRSEEGVTIIDVGGGSTEIIGVTNGEIKGFSLDIGSVRLTEMFITQHPTPESEIRSIQNYVSEHLNIYNSKLPQNTQKVIAVAGTPTTLAAMSLQTAFSSDVINSYKMSLADLRNHIRQLSPLSLTQRMSIKGMDKGREDVIIAGACILLKTTEHLGVNEITVSTKGVRYGLASEMGKQ